ncbi:MAG: DUF364 domain-containing protein [Dethiobacteria bacterium]|jgi:uncharacterized protein (DUF4213/DUF364 family)|nr:DUF364 domain-containing protein [Bacillota bacterium]NMD34018.1 DUF364 domain-containing protein [Bacillota bacterium]HOB28752.1 DUF364 domain-containing protein [Bacillota bacterium]HPZ41440.1 DUF364 domain-containing protein [Bacillota bacterium]HQD51707.1 DUF364 domain-containing protein [Bacillota bacterium]
MIIESVLRSARPYLQGRKVKDVVIGLSLLAAELDNGYIGVSYVLREGLKGGCSAFPYGQQLIGEDATDIAAWAVNGSDHLQRAVGTAVLAAASRAQKLKDSEVPGRPFGIELRESDTVGMIGHISPVVKMIRPQVKELYLFDEGKSKCGRDGDPLFPVEEQPRLLPACDIVILSGTTVINGSVDELLKFCSCAREVVMIGASTPIFPDAFLKSKVSVLAGSWWKSEHKEDIFKIISLAGGMRDLGPYAIKKSVKVHSLA